MTAGKKKESGSMLVMLKTEPEKSMFGQIAVGLSVLLLIRATTNDYFHYRLIC